MTGAYPIKAMAFRTTRCANGPRRPLWQAVIAHAMALVVFIGLLVPHPAFAAGAVADLASVTITSTSEDTNDFPSGSGDTGLVHQAYCACHTAIRPSWSAASVEPVRSAADFSARADTPPRPSPASLPFKPPRA